VKREGDGRSPAGVFELERAFGEAEALPPDSHGFPYLQAQRTSYCVEEVRSEHYNQLVDSTQIKMPGWQRWSPLRRPDGLFRWGVVVRQNAPDTVVGAGSCVFLHIWRGPRQPTSGCTAMHPDHLEALLRWLDPKAHPILVQLPEPEYQARKEAWSLP
jgi:D-alanyl-D-alanine dipeptidase